MRILFFALFLATAAFAQSPAIWQNRQLMPSPFAKPAPQAVTKPLIGEPAVTGPPKKVLAKPERCTPPMRTMKRPERFSSAMPLAPADPAVDPGIVSKVRVCEP